MKVKLVGDKAFGVPLSSATFLPSYRVNANNTIKKHRLVVLTTTIVSFVICIIHQHNKRVVKVEKGEVG